MVTYTALQEALAQVQDTHIHPRRGAPCYNINTITSIVHGKVPGAQASRHFSDRILRKTDGLITRLIADGTIETKRRADGAPIKNATKYITIADYILEVGPHLAEDRQVTEVPAAAAEPVVEITTEIAVPVTELDPRELGSSMYRLTWLRPAARHIDRMLIDGEEVYQLVPLTMVATGKTQKACEHIVDSFQAYDFVGLHDFNDHIWWRLCPNEPASIPGLIRTANSSMGQLANSGHEAAVIATRAVQEQVMALPRAEAETVVRNMQEIHEQVAGAVPAHVDAVIPISGDTETERKRKYDEAMLEAQTKHEVAVSKAQEKVALAKEKTLQETQKTLQAVQKTALVEQQAALARERNIAAEAKRAHDKDMFERRLANEKAKDKGKGPAFPAAAAPSAPLYDPATDPNRLQYKVSDAPPPYTDLHEMVRYVLKRCFKPKAKATPCIDKTPSYMVDLWVRAVRLGFIPGFGPVDIPANYYAMTPDLEHFANTVIKEVAPGYETVYTKKVDTLHPKREVFEAGTYYGYIAYNVDVKFIRQNICDLLPDPSS